MPLCDHVSERAVEEEAAEQFDTHDFAAERIPGIVSKKRSVSVNRREKYTIRGVASGIMFKRVAEKAVELARSETNLAEESENA